MAVWTQYAIACSKGTNCWSIWKSFYLVYHSKGIIIAPKKRRVIKMQLNNKYMSLGVTLFSALILISLSSETVKADTTSPSTVTTTSDSKTIENNTGANTGNTVTSNTSIDKDSMVNSKETAESKVSTVTTAKISPQSNIDSKVSSETFKIPTQPLTNQPSTTQPSSEVSTENSNPYAISSNITDNTIVNFTDPLLGSVVKAGLSLKPSDNITIGDIKSFKNTLIDVSVSTYQLQNKNQPGASMTNQQSTPIESLNGMQYLQLLPSKAQIAFQAKLASDSQANSDLTPLEKLNFNQLVIAGDLSDPRAKMVDLKPLSKFDLSKTNYLELSGDTSISANSGLNDEKLAEVAPVINKFANNGLNNNLLELGQSSITDFTPLKPALNAAPRLMIVAAANTVANPTPIYAVVGQPISFTAPKLLDPAGNDLADRYHFSYSVPQSDLTNDNLTNLGNNKYVLNNPDPNNKILYYGQAGWAYSSNPDAVITERLGNAIFRTVLMNAQPIVWQAHPNVTINYMDDTGKPILSKGSPLVANVTGYKIGDPFDITANSKIAGYTLTSPVAMLKGSFTQNPQTISLLYRKIESEGSGYTVKENKNSSRIVAEIHYLDSKNNEDRDLINIGVKGTAIINGKLFYLVGYKQLVEASSYSIIKSNVLGIARITDNAALIFNAYSEPIGALEPNTLWKYSQIVSLDGIDYYQIATNEFLPVKDSLQFVSLPSSTVIKVVSNSELYDSKGAALDRVLSKNSKWKTDGYAVINGTKMYHIATDEWISSQNIVIS